MGAHANKQCGFCILPEDIQGSIYDLLVRQGINTRQAYQEIRKVIIDRGLKVPAQSSFYTHVKNHLDPEKDALARISKAEDRLSDTAKGFRGVILAYLTKKFEEERTTRKHLRDVIEKLNSRIKDGSPDDQDLAKMCQALGYTVKVLQEGSITTMVQDKVIDDLIAGVVYSIQKMIAEGLGETRQTLMLQIKGNDALIKGEMDQLFERLIKGAGEFGQMAVKEMETLRNYKK